jgi:hypothetical protein
MFEKRSGVFQACAHVVLWLQILVGVGCSGGAVATTPREQTESTSQAFTKGPGGGLPACTSCAGWSQCSGPNGTCVACGAVGQVPCDDPSAGIAGCQGYAQSVNLSLNILADDGALLLPGQDPGTCQPCGGAGGGVNATECVLSVGPFGTPYGAQYGGCANARAGVNAAEECALCGAANQPPCNAAGAQPCEPGLTDSDPSGGQGSAGVCVPCGAGGELACATGAPCAAGAIYASGQCVECGLKAGEPACDASGTPACGAGLVEMSDVCQTCGLLGNFPCPDHGCVNSTVYLATTGTCGALEQTRWECGQMATSGLTTGLVSFIASNTGAWWYSGGVNDGSPIGQDYAVGVKINWTNPATGAQIAQVYSQAAAPDLPGSNPNSIWAFGGVEPLIAANWSAVRASSMDCNMGVGVNPGMTSLQIIFGLFVVAVVVAVVAFIAMGGVDARNNGDGTWTFTPHEPGGGATCAGGIPCTSSPTSP